MGTTQSKCKINIPLVKMQLSMIYTDKLTSDKDKLNIILSAHRKIGIVLDVSEIVIYTEVVSKNGILIKDQERITGFNHDDIMEFIVDKITRITTNYSNVKTKKKIRNKIRDMRNNLPDD